MYECKEDKQDCSAANNVYSNNRVLCLCYVPVNDEFELTSVIKFSVVGLELWRKLGKEFRLTDEAFPLLQTRCYHISNSKDVDECNEEKHDCSSNATCQNTVGSFKCRCNDGYQGDGKTCNGK